MPPNDKVKGVFSAQDRKEISISFFNSVNSAIALMGVFIKNTEVVDGANMASDKDNDRLKENIVYWRDWFLSEHAEYREKALAKFQANMIEGGDAIERLNKATNLVDLKAVWITLTEDERRNEKIINVCKEQQKKYANIS